MKLYATCCNLLPQKILITTPACSPDWKQTVIYRGRRYGSRPFWCQPLIIPSLSAKFSQIKSSQIFSGKLDRPRHKPHRLTLFTQAITAGARTVVSCRPQTSELYLDSVFTLAQNPPIYFIYNLLIGCYLSIIFVRILLLATSNCLRRPIIISN